MLPLAQANEKTATGSAPAPFTHLFQYAEISTSDRAQSQYFCPFQSMACRAILTDYVNTWLQVLGRYGVKALAIAISMVKIGPCNTL